ncbi:MAG TPA: hypothetical protein PLE30_00725 [Candidatus Kapabacteria bacterium]|nr:hypothetical protein [Candidatus Kapabacteria bacterium]
MNLKEKEILDKIINNSVSISEQRSALIFLSIIFMLGWASGIVDYSNFYSDIPALIQLAIFAIIILLPFYTIILSSKYANNTKSISFLATFIFLSSYTIKRLLVSFAFLIIIYVASYTVLKEFYDIVLYEVQYYFSTGIILFCVLLYHQRIIKYIKYIYRG